MLTSIYLLTHPETGEELFIGRSRWGTIPKLNVHVLEALDGLKPNKVILEMVPDAQVSTNLTKWILELSPVGNRRAKYIKHGKEAKLEVRWEHVLKVELYLPSYLLDYASGKGDLNAYIAMLLLKEAER